MVLPILNIGVGLKLLPIHLSGDSSAILSWRTINLMRVDCTIAEACTPRISFNSNDSCARFWHCNLLKLLLNTNFPTFVCSVDHPVSLNTRSWKFLYSTCTQNRSWPLCDIKIGVWIILSMSFLSVSGSFQTSFSCNS